MVEIRLQSRREQTSDLKRAAPPGGLSESKTASPDGWRASTRRTHPVKTPLPGSPDEVSEDAILVDGLV